MYQIRQLKIHEAELTEMKGKVGKFTITVGNFNILLLEIGRNSRKSACKDLK